LIARCFRCSGRKFTAGSLSFAAESLDSEATGNRNNSERLAVVRCFPLFSTTWRPRRDLDKIAQAAKYQNSLILSITEIANISTNHSGEI
jgi:hypothetical protein